MDTPVVYLGAEQAFRLRDLETTADQVTGVMPPGPWLADRHGTPVAGSLGVLVDDVLGYALIRARAADGWSVSSEISIDVVRPLDFTPVAEPLQAATVGARSFDPLGGHTSGTVSAAGEIVAVCAQRGRWVPFDGVLAAGSPPPVDLDGATCVEDLLGGTPDPVEGGAALRLQVGPVLQNPLGNMHGGLSLCASDLVAGAAVTTWATPWLTESLRIQYLRPVPAGADVVFTAAVRHAGRTRAVVDVTGVVGGRVCTLAHVTGRPAPA